MQISLWVPYDEQQLRRTLQFVLRPQVKLIRILGAVLIAVGLGLAVLDPTTSLAYVAVVLGIMFLVAIAPMTVALSMRMQSSTIKDGLQMTLDDEWVSVTYPLAESRFRWAGLGNVIETPEVWYIMFGKAQALTIPKNLMSDEQRTEFASFVARLQPA